MVALIEGETEAHRSKATKPQPEIQPTFREDDAGNFYNEDGEEIIGIPALNISASAGTGTFNFEPTVRFIIPLDIFLKTTKITENITQKDLENGKYFFITALGDSMEPYIEDGSVILIKKTHEEWSLKDCFQHQKQILVLEDIEGELYVKECFRDVGGVYSVISYNHEYSSIHAVPFIEIEKKFKRCLGRVIWHSTRTNYLKLK